MSSIPKSDQPAAKVAVKVPRPDSLVEVRVTPPESNFEIKVSPGAEVIEVSIRPGSSLVEVRISPPPRDGLASETSPGGSGDWYRPAPDDDDGAAAGGADFTALAMSKQKMEAIEPPSWPNHSPNDSGLSLGEAIMQPIHDAVSAAQSSFEARLPKGPPEVPARPLPSKNAPFEEEPHAATGYELPEEIKKLLAGDEPGAPGGEDALELRDEPAEPETLAHVELDAENFTETAPVTTEAQLAMAEDDFDAPEEQSAAATPSWESHGDRDEGPVASNHIESPAPPVTDAAAAPLPEDDEVGLAAHEAFDLGQAALDQAVMLDEEATALAGPAVKPAALEPAGINEIEWVTEEEPEEDAQNPAAENSEIIGAAALEALARFSAEVQEEQAALEEAVANPPQPAPAPEKLARADATVMVMLYEDSEPHFNPADTATPPPEDELMDLSQVELDDELAIGPIDVAGLGELDLDKSRLPESRGPQLPIKARPMVQAIPGNTVVPD